MKLYHVTSAQNLMNIKSCGLNAGSYLTDSLDIVDYYMETIVDEGDSAAVVEISCEDLLEAVGSGSLIKDDASIAEPISSCIDVKEEDVIRLWQECEGTWKDSLRIVRSIRCTSRIPSSCLIFDDLGLVANSIFS